MNSGVIETKDKIFIDKIPQLKWGENTENSFIRSTQLTLNALSENYSYDFLMGISGSAFRLDFKPGWCPSSVDATTGFDVSKILFKSLGFNSELHSIDDNNFEDIKSLYKKIIAQINLGIPIIAINLKVCPEWGIITGYLKDKPGILCRTYFDKTEEYSLAEHAPWLSFFIGEKEKAINDNELFINSLKIAVELAKTDKFDEYKSGYSAFKMWIEELKKQSEAIKTFVFKEYEVNLTIFNSLLDSRKAAVSYLTLMNDKMKKGDLIIDNYKKEVELLTETQKNVLPSFNAKENSWTADIINKQIDILTSVLSIEKETIKLIQQEVKS
ncbi:MAG: hypothetical protein HKM87_10285 [Ignavibacteriaceae bacterium]|nr:hypothetical protein [Ignavibacteriaceae bacterium]